MNATSPAPAAGQPSKTLHHFNQKLRWVFSSDSLAEFTFIPNQSESARGVWVFLPPSCRLLTTVTSRHGIQHLSAADLKQVPTWILVELSTCMFYSHLREIPREAVLYPGVPHLTQDFLPTRVLIFILQPQGCNYLMSNLARS